MYTYRYKYILYIYTHHLNEYYFSSIGNQLSYADVDLPAVQGLCTLLCFRNSYLLGNSFESIYVDIVLTE